MDQKEIEKAIWENVDFNSFGLVGVDEAAHAIHERMKEGVVWEGEGQIVHPRLSHGAAVSVPGIGRLSIDNRPNESRIGPHGLRVQVTVRRIPCNESTNQDSGEE